MSKRIISCDKCINQDVSPQDTLAKSACGINPSKIVCTLLPEGSFGDVYFNDRRYTIVDCPGYAEKRFCEFTSIDDANIIMKVDGKSIRINKLDEGYFEDHYKKLQYKIVKRDWLQPGE